MKIIKVWSFTFTLRLFLHEMLAMYRRNVATYLRRNQFSRLAIITVMFNPVRYQTRYQRYRQFAYHMARSGVNLFTIECIFESATRYGLPPQRFEVTQPNNPQHFQVIAPSIIWMKENLINIVVQQLPPHIDRIAWIDADVEFEVRYHDVLYTHSHHCFT